jgi:hypothetical protein
MIEFDPGGRMIARAGGLVVLVSGAIPGERVRAVVERVGKGVVYAAVTAKDFDGLARYLAGLVDHMAAAGAETVVLPTC